jgi:farnesyl diphosphate synthase
MDGELERWRREVDARLAQALPAAPGGLAQAMAYALTGPGKRLRPLMVLGAATAAGANPPGELAWRAAVAVESVHAYSLVHDDLPAMDDDDLRRGRPTVHRAFGEAQAILVGDALQALAFAAIAAPGLAPAEAAAALGVCDELAAAAGAEGMVGGQYLELTLPLDAGADAMESVHRLKTGALFRAAARMGARAAGAGAELVERLGAFGAAFGALYQALDDLADDDADARRPSLARSLGREGLEARVSALRASARAALAEAGAGTAALAALLREAAGEA